MGAVMAKKQLGYYSLTKTIHLAKMRDGGNGTKIRVGNDTEDVTNECALMVYNLVKDEGGEISWAKGVKKLTLRAIETDA